MRSSRTLVALAVGVSLASTARAEESDATLRATRLSEPLTIDGVLEERIYKDTPTIEDFVQQEPDEGAPITERTEAWIFFDDEAIYVCGRMWV